MTGWRRLDLDSRLSSRFRGGFGRFGGRLGAGLGRRHRNGCGIDRDAGVDGEIPQEQGGVGMAGVGSSVGGQVVERESVGEGANGGIGLVAEVGEDGERLSVDGHNGITFVWLG